jgi:hypothetical protein
VHVRFVRHDSEKSNVNTAPDKRDRQTIRDARVERFVHEKSLARAKDLRSQDSDHKNGRG